jgi:acyl-CoA thioester hydrolase
MIFRNRPDENDPPFKYEIRFEAGRIDFNSLGVSNAGNEKNDVLRPLYEINCKFIAPGKYENEIVIITA